MPTKCLGVRSSEVKKNFTIGRSPEIGGNFLINCAKIIKRIKNYREKLRKCKYNGKNYNYYGYRGYIHTEAR